MSGDTTTITRDAQVRTNVGTIAGMIAATAVAVGATMGTYYSLRSEIASIRQTVAPMEQMKNHVDQLWWEHHVSHASTKMTPKDQP